MDIYLLDTNLMSVLYGARRPNHSALRRMVASLDPEALQLVSVVTIAELKYGLGLSRSAGQPLTHIEACVERTGEHRVADQRLDRRAPRWVEGWTDRVTGSIFRSTGMTCGPPPKP